MLKALVFQLLDSTTLSSRWFQIDSTCGPLNYGCYWEKEDDNLIVYLEKEDGRDGRPALIGRYYVTERDSVPVQCNGVV